MAQFALVGGRTPPGPGHHPPPERDCEVYPSAAAPSPADWADAGPRPPTLPARPVGSVPPPYSTLWSRRDIFGSFCKPKRNKSMSRNWLKGSSVATGSTEAASESPDEPSLPGTPPGAACRPRSARAAPSLSGGKRNAARAPRVATASPRVGCPPSRSTFRAGPSLRARPPADLRRPCRRGWGEPGRLGRPQPAEQLADRGCAFRGEAVRVFKTHVYVQRICVHLHQLKKNDRKAMADCCGTKASLRLVSVTNSKQESQTLQSSKLTTYVRTHARTHARTYTHLHARALITHVGDTQLSGDWIRFSRLGSKRLFNVNNCNSRGQPPDTSAFRASNL